MLTKRKIKNHIRSDIHNLTMENIPYLSYIKLYELALFGGIFNKTKQVDSLGCCIYWDYIKITLYAHSVYMQDISTSKIFYEIDHSNVVIKWL